jgi:hypothetical protein
MNRKNAGFPEDRTERQRRKGLSAEEVKELERAGGAEGGMQAGSAGGPGDSETDKPASSMLER